MSRVCHVVGNALCDLCKHALHVQLALLDVQLVLLHVQLTLRARSSCILRRAVRIPRDPTAVTLSGWEGESAAAPRRREGRRRHRLAAPQPRRQRPRQVRCRPAPLPEKPFCPVNCCGWQRVANWPKGSVANYTNIGRKKKARILSREGQSWE